MPRQCSIINVQKSYGEWLIRSIETDPFCIRCVAKLKQFLSYNIQTHTHTHTDTKKNNYVHYNLSFFVRISIPFFVYLFFSLHKLAQKLIHVVLVSDWVCFFVVAILSCHGHIDI